MTASAGNSYVRREYSNGTRVAGFVGDSVTGERIIGDSRVFEGSRIVDGERYVSGGGERFVSGGGERFVNGNERIAGERAAGGQREVHETVRYVIKE